MSPIMADTAGATLLPVRLVSSANVTVGASVTIPATIDSVAPATGDLILLVGQNTPAENGIYQITGTAGATGSIARAANFTYSEQMLPGVTVAAREGNVYRDTLWMLANDTTITVGTTAVVFTRVSPPVLDRLLTAFQGFGPSNGLWESIPRAYTNPTAQAGIVTAGTQLMMGGFTIPAGRTVRSVTMLSGVASVGQTGSWVELIAADAVGGVASGQVLAVSNNFGTTQWAATAATSTTPGTTSRAFSFVTGTGAYTNMTGTDLRVYFGLVQVGGTTQPTLFGLGVSQALSSFTPRLVGPGATAIVAAAAVGATRTLPTAGGAQYPWFLVG